MTKSKRKFVRVTSFKKRFKLQTNNILGSNIIRELLKRFEIGTALET